MTTRHLKICETGNKSVPCVCNFLVIQKHALKFIAVTRNQAKLGGIWAEFKRWLHIYSWGKASSVLPNPTQKSTRCEIGRI